MREVGSIESLLEIPLRFARGLKKCVWEEGWAWLAGFLVLRIGYAFVHLWRTAAGPDHSLLVFGLVTLIILFAPGLFLLRLAGFRDGSLLNRCLMAMGLSLAITTVVVFGLYFAGIYYRWILIAVLAVFSVLGLWGATSLRPSRVLCEVRAGWQSADWLERAAWIFFAGYFVTSLEFSAGRPFTSWDAIVSWDKWGCDMAERSGLGRYCMGGYPQLLPTIYSIYYKISGSFLEGLADEQLLLHGLVLIFPLLLFLALVRLSRLLGAPWVLAVLLLFGNERFEVWVGDGYADIPVTAFEILSLVALLGLLRKDWSCRNESAAWIIVAVLLFAAGFTKAHGLVWILCLASYTIVCLYKGRRLARTRPALALCATITFVLLAPFYLHQEILAHHISLAEKQPRLHTMMVGITHAERVTARGALRATAGFFFGYQPLLAKTTVRPFGMLLAALFASLCLFTLGQRQARPGWIMAAAMSAVWLFTTSYDVRNLFPVLSLLCVLAGLGFSLLAVGRRLGRWAPSVVSLLLILAFCGNFVARRLSEITTLVRPYTNTSFGLWSTSTETRLRAVNPEWDAIARILNQCPTARRARYIYCQNTFFRHLGERGVRCHIDYGLKDLADGDLFLDEGMDRRSVAPFTPIASLAATSTMLPSALLWSPRWGIFPSRDTKPFKELCLYHPKFQLSRYWFQDPQSLDVTCDSAAASATLQGEGTVDLGIEALQGMRPGDSAVVRVAIDGAAEELTMAAHPRLSLTNELSRRLLSATVPGGVHYLLWLNGEDTAPSGEILLQLRKRSARPLVIRNVFVAS